MTSNEEIIKKVATECYNEGWDYHLNQVTECMDLAREDERENAYRFTSAGVFNKGYQKGCADTKEKIKLQVRDIILWTRQWNEYIEDGDVLDLWDKDIALKKDWGDNQYDLTDFKEELEGKR